MTTSYRRTDRGSVSVVGLSSVGLPAIGADQTDAGCTVIQKLNSAFLQRSLDVREGAVKGNPLGRLKVRKGRGRYPRSFGELMPGPAEHGTGAAALFGGNSLRRALSPTFRAGSDAARYPLAGVGAADSGAVLLDRREPPIFLFSKFRCGPIDGARAVRATGSLHIGAGRERTGRGALRHALASTFPAGAIVVFIPWCRGAEARAAN